MPQNQGDWGAFIASLQQWAMALQQEQHAPNVIPSQFQTFQTAAATPVLAALTTTNLTAAVDGTVTYYGSATLKLSGITNPATLQFTGTPIPIVPGGKWFCSFQIIAPSGATGSLAVKTSGGTTVTESFTVASSASAQQVWGLFDLTANSDPQATWILTFTSTSNVNLDGFQMNAVDKKVISFLPRFAGTQMVAGTAAYANNLDGVPDGSTYQRPLATALTSGSVDIAKAGVVGKATEMCRNPDFESGDRDWIKESGFSIVSDGNAYSGSFAAKYVDGGASAGLRNAIQIPVQQGDVLVATCMVKRTAGTGGGGSVRISWLNSSTTEIADSNGNIVTSSTYATSRVVAAAPANAAFAVANGLGVTGGSNTCYFDGFNIALFVKNLDEVADGSTYGRPLAARLSSGKPWIDFSESIHSNKILDNIADGSTYGRVKIAGLTSGIVDPSIGGVTAKGSVPPIVLGVGFSWSCDGTGTQLTISWSAFTVYRPDGTTTSISAGPQVVTGLAAGTAYGIYPYIAEGATTVSFATGFTSSHGSPAIAYWSGTATASAPAAQKAYSFGNIPLQSFVVSMSASGGGGGDQLGCPREDSEVETANRGVVPAGELSSGDLFHTPTGTAPILSIERRPRSRWVKVGLAGTATYETTVTPEHVFYDSGGMVRAQELKLGALVTSDGGVAEVRSLELLSDAADSIVLSLPEPHLYFERRGGAMAHNGNPKP